jgi:hypothetical protein
MLSSYFIIIEIKEPLSSHINKILFCKTIESAYDFAIYLKPYSYLVHLEINKLINESQQLNIIWTTNKNIFPIYVCKLLPINNYILDNLYQNNYNLNSSDLFLIKRIYENLISNSFITLN